jgi:glutamyl/glutaminyl-tRNA synthetase
MQSHSVSAYFSKHALKCRRILVFSNLQYLLRVSGVRHHRIGRQWNIYPTYDFCAPILDSIENVTIALRTNEYRDRNVQYEWMQDALGLRKVHFGDFSVRTPVLLRFSLL